MSKNVSPKQDLKPECEFKDYALLTIKPEELDIKEEPCISTLDKSSLLPSLNTELNHKKMKDIKPIALGGKLFMCASCGYKTPRKFDMHRHLITHAGDQPYNCDLCVYKCSRKSNLVKHMEKIHPIGKPLSSGGDSSGVPRKKK